MTVETKIRLAREIMDAAIKHIKNIGFQIHTNNGKGRKKLEFGGQLIFSPEEK